MGAGHMGIQEFFQKFNKEHIDLVDQFYHPKIHFIDPMVNFTNRDDLRRYYEKLYKNVDSIRFDFSSEVVQGDTHVAVWTMTLVAKGFNGGKPVIVDGVSHIRFAMDDSGRKGQAIYHRDYFDMGVFVYQNVPILSGIIRLVNKIMSGQHGKEL